MTDLKIRIARGQSEQSKRVSNTEIDWADFVAEATVPKVRPNHRDYIMAGQCVGGARNIDAVKYTSTAIIDIDDKQGVSGVNVSGIIYALEFGLPYHWLLYTTRSYDGNNTCCRVVVPFDGDLAASHHATVVKAIVAKLPANAQALVDKVSYLPHQIMFAPCVKAEGAPYITEHGGSSAYPVGEYAIKADAVKVDAVPAVDTALEDIVLSAPLDLSDEDVDKLLSELDPETLTYGLDDGTFGWANVIAALSHQYQGNDVGLAKAMVWSKRNPDKHDGRTTRAKYKSFARGRGNGRTPVTMASVIAYVHNDNSNPEQSTDLVNQLLDDIEALESTNNADYVALRDKIKAIPSHQLPDDQRSIVAHALSEQVKEWTGLSKRDVKKAITPDNKKKRLTANEPPEWCRDWVYVESTCEFANTRLNYAIKREAFNAKFDRMEDCLISEASASHMALNVYQIGTVVDKMFWPGAETIFEHDGKSMLNAYHINGVEPCDVIDDDGQAVVDMFLNHVRFSVTDEREQRILIDWLAYVVQNPGRRVNWALLIQGAQGSGKSYFVKMLQYVLGDHVRNLDPTAIAGRFTGWAHGALVIGVEEIRISGTNRYEVLDRMKPFITNDTVQIEEKGRDHRTVPNFTNYLMLTNHKDAIPLTSGDRRYCVIFSRIQSEEQLYREKGGEKGVEEYFETLFSETERRADALARFLLDWRLSAEFNPRGRAPDTKARQMMMSVATSPERLALEDAMAKHHCGVINDEILDVTWLNNLCRADGDEIPKNRTLSSILLEMGYEQIDKKRVKIAKTGVYHYVWFKGDDGSAVIKTVREFHNGTDLFIPF